MVVLHPDQGPSEHRTQHGGGSRLISRPLADFTHVNESTDVSDGLPAQPAIRGTYLQSGANLSGDHSHVQDCSV